MRFSTVAGDKIAARAVRRPVAVQGIGAKRTYADPLSPDKSDRGFGYKRLLRAAIGPWFRK
jgi:hypothetical protein